MRGLRSEGFADWLGCMPWGDEQGVVDGRLQHVLLSWLSLSSPHRSSGEMDSFPLPSSPTTSAYTSDAMVAHSPRNLQDHLYASFLEGSTSDVALHISGSWHAVYRLHRVVLIQAVSFVHLSHSCRRTEPWYSHHRNSSDAFLPQVSRNHVSARVRRVAALNRFKSTFQIRTLQGQVCLTNLRARRADIDLLFPFTTAFE